MYPTIINNPNSATILSLHNIAIILSFAYTCVKSSVSVRHHLKFITVLAIKKSTKASIPTHNPELKKKQYSN